MRFALLGDHPDGRAAAAALAAGGRHELTAYTTAADADLRRWAAGARRVADLEEILADPAVEAVIVAGGRTTWPPSSAAPCSPSGTSSAFILPERPPISLMKRTCCARTWAASCCRCCPARCTPPSAGWPSSSGGPPRSGGAASPVGAFRLLEMEQAAAAGTGAQADLPRLGPAAGAGRRDRRGVRARGRRTRRGRRAGAGVGPLRGRRTVPGDVPAGPARRRDAAGRGRRSRPGGTGVSGRLAGTGLSGLDGRIRRNAGRGVGCVGPVAGAGGAVRVGRGGRGRLRPAWLDAVRGLELDDAARRSVERRRSSVLEYQEASEETGFKGTMTLVGCGLIWAMLILLVRVVLGPADPVADRRAARALPRPAIPALHHSQTRSGTG